MRRTVESGSTPARPRKRSHVWHSYVYAWRDSPQTRQALSLLVPAGVRVHPAANGLLRVDATCVQARWLGRIVGRPGVRIV